MMVHAFLVAICTFFIPYGGLFAATQKSEVKQILHNLSLDDHKNLESFFRRVLFVDGFAYTLFGDKPISSECFEINNVKKIDSCYSRLPGYRVWEKYAHLIPQDRFIFLFYEDLDKNYCEVTLINKRALHQIICKHKEKFSEIFGSEINAEKLLNILIQSRSLWNAPMKDRDDLIGILLGFGKPNAELFQKRREILGKNMGIKRNRVKPSTGYNSVNEELTTINTALQSFSNEQPNSLYYMYLPGFMADPHHAETIQLKKKYIEQRKCITQRYSQGNIIDVTLEQLYAE